MTYPNIALYPSLCTCVLALFSLCGNAQRTVSAKLVLPDGHRPGGTVRLLDTADSTLLGGTFFLDGAVALTDVPATDLLLHFTSLEFAPFYRRLPAAGPDQLGVITVRPPANDLEAITVTGRRAVYRQRSDGTVEVRVQGTALANAASTLDVLRRSPDLTTDENGTVTVLGKGAAIYYLDGQRVPPEQLAMIPPAEIAHIAIIRNPSAKYEAGGAAVIEIRTVRGPRDGYRLAGQQQAGYSDFGGRRSYTALSAGGNLGKLSARANADLTLGEDRFVKFTTRDRTDPAVFFSSDVTIDWQPEQRPHSNFGAGLQYDFSDRAYASLSYGGSYRRTAGRTLNQNLLEDAAEALVYNNTIERDDRARNHSVSANYGLKLDTAGSELFIAGQFTDLRTDFDNPIAEVGQTAAGPTARRLQNRVDLDIRIRAMQADYTAVLSPHHQLEAGLRHAHVRNGADIAFRIAETGQDFRPAPTLSSFYSYTERVNAAYLNYQGQLRPGLSLTAGLRAEHTDYDLWLDAVGDDRLQNRYLDLFPNLSLVRTWSDDLRLSFNYAARLQRPAYESLNPNPIYQDPYTTVQGNPLLVPQRTHAVEAVLGWAGATAKLGYTYTRDPFGGSALPGDDARSYVLKRLNLSEAHEGYLSLSRGFTLPWWTSMNTASLSYGRIAAFEFAFVASSPRPQPYFLTDNRFTLGRLGHLELLFYYVGRLREGTIDRYDYADLTLTYEKRLYEEALTVRLQAGDIFNTVRASGEYGQGETDITFDNKWRSTFLRFSVNFLVGRSGKREVRNREAGASERRRAG